jgi:ribonuclease HI
MTENVTTLRDGAHPLKSRREGGVPGPQPQRGPPSATGGPPSSTRQARGRGRRENATGNERTPSKTINILQWNAEGVYNKKVPLAQLLHQEEVEIACIQETHLKNTQRFSIRGYQVFRYDREDRSKGGAAILVKNSIPARELQVNTNHQSEIHGVTVTIENQEIKIFNVYSPVDRELCLNSMDIPDSRCLVIGDFNSHSETWGYSEADRRGEEVEDWQIDNKLLLLNDPEDPPTFFSRRWLTTTTPDLAFATEDLAKKTTRSVQGQLGGSDHKPVLICLDMHHKPQEAKTFPRWNYKRAKWDKFSTLVDQYSETICSKHHHLNQKVKDFNKIILKAAKETIPRGARKDYRPYWTEELQQLEDEVSEAREAVENDPTVENNISLKAATAKHRKVLNEEARRSWHEKTEQLNLDKDGSKLWNLAKAMNDESSKSSPITLQHNDQLISGKQAADHFIQQYAKTSDLEVPPERDQEVRETQRQYKQTKGEPLMNSPFTTAELEDALKTLKLRKSPGADKITNEMLLNLGPKAKKKLLQLMNESWRTGIVPQVWREAIMIPVHKKGKDKSKADSYRPISLTSCMGKLAERLINTRLMWHLEQKQHIGPEQAAFRRNRSTEDQVTYITQEIEDAFQDKKHTLTVWIDLEKAFDKVWKNGLRLKLRQCGVAGRMYQWISQYMQNRSSRVQIKQHQSKAKVLKQGVPQGGVLSPTLFLVFMKDILHRLPKNVKGAMYADDLALWCSEEHVSTANYRLKLALQEIEKWTKAWLVKINAKKTTYTLFTLSNRPQKVSLQLGNEALQEEDTPTYLGVTLDRRLTWKHQLQKNQTKAKIRMALMKKLAGTNWGAEQKVLKKLYIGRVRPVLDYGMASTCTAAKTNADKTNRIQNQAMRIMTGAMQSSPITMLETTTGLHALEDRRDIKVLSQAAKFKRLTNHPMCERMSKPTKSRLKRSSFVHHSRKLEKRDPELLEHEPKPLQSYTAVPTWERSTFPTIQKTVPGIGNKGTQSTTAQKALTLAHIHSSYPEEEWSHVYTDGSATEATRNGGGGIFIKYKEEEARISIPTGKYSTNYKAEAVSIQTAATHLQENLHKTHKKIAIFSDALSVLEALQSPQKKELNELTTSLIRLSSEAEVTLQWIPAHCGVYGNEAADKLAKEGGEMDQNDKSVSYQDEKTIIKTLVNSKWRQLHPSHNPADSYFSLDRADQVILFRLRSGHNRMNAHLFRLKIVPTDKCPCKTAPMTTQHLLMDCPLHEVIRQATWPNATALMEKLYGGILELQKTASFVRATDVTV